MWEVRTPSSRVETVQVLRALAHIVLWSTAVIVAGRAARASGPVRDGLAMDETAFSTLPSPEQRMYRLALEGASEAEDTRARTGAWPSVATLAGRGIPPFATDPLDHAGYHWTQVHDGTVTNYVGAPDPASHAPTWLIVVVEPDPGTAPDPGAPTDETHHRLKDGTMLHVMIWMGAHGVTEPIAAPRLEDGWHRITSVVGGARA